MKQTIRLYDVVSSGRDEYPGDGLRLRTKDALVEFSTELLRDVGVSVQEGDEVEISIRVVSRLVTRREPAG